MRLVWSDAAVSDRDTIFDYIALENPQAAIEVDLKLSAAVNRLLVFPLSGRTGRVERTRELPLVGTPYIVVYLVDGERVRVLRVLHGAQMWPD
ncbi:type II toxin-antitoxin system RelE/ParE family toxin [Rhizobium sp. SL86]|uniref:type II toxin-antitoxin system RelE/ParE family toxin n=1 Tax=Rhizobium sp. SL86 TaxID=2995148 RepID=UPI00227420B5|nr:type II toxin-antitoxin system RelE/ParE family toxin [Rhizobium sp. SL86]MCY1664192.1 type II toxin-antitoxin system RelE/ParE family toxin [Rhizobium sp. SL86]